ncbi:hypothetical protein NPIL_262251 [Nephila pilipes]|uniref:Uncharacterized protein n=1 Tax=Nephila pilipes TaxID=299642 RepID=A0A8X6QTM4_NEPPI|nr:hypothetical protein NPIL_262251 [Nephila pilipes]
MQMSSTDLISTRCVPIHFRFTCPTHKPQDTSRHGLHSVLIRPLEEIFPGSMEFLSRPSIVSYRNISCWEGSKLCLKTDRKISRENLGIVMRWGYYFFFISRIEITGFG